MNTPAKIYKDFYRKSGGKYPSALRQASNQIYTQSQTIVELEKSNDDLSKRLAASIKFTHELFNSGSPYSKQTQNFIQEELIKRGIVDG